MDEIEAKAFEHMKHLICHIYDKMGHVERHPENFWELQEAMVFEVFCENMKLDGARELPAELRVSDEEWAKVKSNYNSKF